MVPEAYPPRQVQKIRSTLTKVIEECCELGFVEAEASEATRTATTPPRKTKARKTAPPRLPARTLGTGELRALMASCAARGGAQGYRDAVIFALVYRGLRTSEITALGIDSVRVDKHGRCQIAVASKSGGRPRRVELTNEELIYLEDWLDLRDALEGPLLCTLGKNNRPEGKRLSLALIKEICEQRAEQAEVAPFSANDLTRTAEAITQHRKTARRRNHRHARAALDVVENLLFEGQADDADAHPDGEPIQFPFLGLNV